ncbi:MAG: HAD family phosphatase [archaeon]|jgi:HAD superfamily hydrolase (TIGR01509 family)
MLKAIIFDMDGVLVNSPPFITKSFGVLLKEYGVVLTPEQRKKSVGMSLRDQLKEWEKEFSLPKIDPLEFSKKSFKIELSLMENELRPNKTITSLISCAKQKGVKIAVATSSTKERAKRILDLIKVSKYLDALVTAEDVALHKPNPDLFLKAAELVGAKPSECVVFEDAKNGIEAANRAEMKSIALLTELTAPKDFEGTADLIIKDFSEVNLKLLEELVNTA